MKKIVREQLWVKKEGKKYKIGLTNQGQDDLGSISFVTLPKVGDILKENESFADVEAEKAVTELTCPLGGKVVEVNEEALNDSSLLDVKNENFAWMIVLSDVNESDFENL